MPNSSWDRHITTTLEPKLEISYEEDQPRQYLIEFCSIKSEVRNRLGIIMREGGCYALIDDAKFGDDFTILEQVYKYACDYATEMDMNPIIQMMVEVRQEKANIRIDNTVYTFEQLEPWFNKLDAKYIGPEPDYPRDTI